MTARPFTHALFSALLCVPLAATPVSPLVANPGRDRQAPPSSGTGKQQQKPPRIRSEVNLVSVMVSVLDAQGKPLPDLPMDAFSVLEEGVQQKIEVFEPETSVPLDLALMVDTSLSTQIELQFEREAAARFIEQILKPGDRLAIYQFADVVTLLADFSGNVRLLQRAVRTLESEAGTALYDAVLLGSQALSRQPLGRRRVVVLVTDAGETTSATAFEDARRAAIASGTMLYTILIRPVKNESGRNTRGEHALLNIIDVTGGALYQPDSMQQVEEVFDRISRELRTQYRLGYYPAPRPPAGSFRQVVVRVSPPNFPGGSSGPYAVHHRKGYLATSSAP